jgi:hypothetical protein
MATRTRARRLPVLVARQMFYEAIGALRARARRLGYALAGHGSLGRDIDIVAVPWVASAAPAEELIEALRDQIETTLGRRAWWIDERNSTGVPPEKISPVTFAHGRRAWSIYLSGASTYFDISILSRGDDR